MNTGEPASRITVFSDVKDRALEVLGTLQGNEEEGPMMGEST